MFEEIFYYFFFQLFGFIYGCGGIKFQPYIFEASMDCSAHIEGKATAKTIVPIVIVCIILASLYIGGGIGYKIAINNLNDYYNTYSNYYNNNSTSSSAAFSKTLNLQAYGYGEITYTFTCPSSGTYRVEVNSNDYHSNVYVYVEENLLLNGAESIVSETRAFTGNYSYSIKFGYNSTSSYSDLDWTKPIELTIKFDPSGAGFCHVTYLVNGVEAVSYDTSENTMRTTKWGSSINMYYGADLESGTDGSAILEWMEYTAPMNWDE